MPAMTTDTIVKVLPSATAYTVSTNMTLAPLEVSGGSDGSKATFDLSVADGDDPITVRMAGSVTFADNEVGCIRIVNKRNADFIGGIWDFGGKKALTAGYQTYGDRDIVLSGGCVWTNLTMGNFVYNYGSGKENNHLLVTDKSQLHITGGMYLNEYGGGIKVVLGAQSGGLVKFGEGFVVGRGTTGSTRHRVFASGKGSKIVTGTQPFIGSNGAKDNVVEALDGGTLSFGGNPYFTYSDDAGGVSATGNVIRAVGSGSLIKMQSLYFGRNNNSYEVVKGDDGKNRALITDWKGSYDNIVAAYDGGLVSNDLYYVRGTGNGFVISNGVIATTLDGIVCQVLPDAGAASMTGAANACTNAYLRLQGDHPRLIMHAPKGTKEGNFVFANGFRFIYDLPKDGYAAGCIPVYSARWGKMHSTTKLELNGIEEMQESMRAQRIRKRTIPLWCFNGGINADTSVVRALVAKWNTQLPKGATLSGDNILTLTVKLDLGLMVIVR